MRHDGKEPIYYLLQPQHLYLIVSEFPCLDIYHQYLRTFGRLFISVVLAKHKKYNIRHQFSQSSGSYHSSGSNIWSTKSVSLTSTNCVNSCMNIARQIFIELHFFVGVCIRILCRIGGDRSILTESRLWIFDRIWMNTKPLDYKI